MKNLIAASLLFLASSANAGLIFSQDYESGLTGRESVSGNFSINSSNAQNNGTLMMGHPSRYGNGAEDRYSLMLDLTGVVNTSLAFDFIGRTERHFDGFVLLANGAVLAPRSGPAYDDEGHSHSWIGDITLDGNWDGVMTYDLTAFDDAALTLEWLFGSDGSVRRSGIVWDNLVVTGDFAGSEIPAPSSMALMALALACVGARVRKQRQSSAG